MGDIFANPDHYAAGRKYEPKDIIMKYGLNFNMGNVVKYISRAGRKEGSSYIEDLKKARQYATFELEHLKQSGIYEELNAADSELEKIQADWKIHPYLCNALDEALCHYSVRPQFSMYTSKKAAVQECIKWLDIEISRMEESHD